MKVVAFNGSPRPDGNTATLLKLALEELERQGIETELVQVGHRRLHGCMACYKCAERKDRRCAFDDDGINEYVEKLCEADGILLGSPTYFADVSAQMKAFIDRTGLVCRVNGNLLRRKVGAGVVAVRRGGSIHAFGSLNHYFLIAEMVVPGSIYWNLGIGKDKGEVLADEEGVQTARQLGENMGWVLERLYGGTAP
jgi:multimeric flavodoxin WrbA